MKKIIGLIISLVSVICFTTANAGDTIKVPARFTACSSPVTVYMLIGAMASNDLPFAFNLFKLDECWQFDEGTVFDVTDNKDMTGNILELKKKGTSQPVYTHPTFNIFTKTKI